MLQKYLFKVILMLAFKELWAATTPETEKDAVNAYGLKNENDAAYDCDSYCFNVLKPMLEHIRLLEQRWQSCNITQQSVEEERLREVDQQLQQERDKVNDFEHKMAVTIEELAKQKNLMEHVKCSTPFQKLGNKYYYIEESEQMNWFAAAHRCHELGSHLVKLESLDELNLVSAKLKKSHVYWVDMHDLSKEGEFISLTTGVKPKFQDWHKDEPSNGENNEHCVSLNDTHNSDRKFHMNDLGCKTKNYFICESPKYAACENNK